MKYEKNEPNETAAEESHESTAQERAEESQRLKVYPRPTGELQGDDKPFRDAGTKSGMNGDDYGADLSADATNRMGSITSATRSDPADQCYPSPAQEGKV